MPQEHYAYVLVEEEKWWNRRRTRSRMGSVIHAFVRRGRVGPKEAQRILFYVKHPVKQIRGSGDFLERVVGTGDELWRQYGSETVFESRDEYDLFVDGRSSVTVIRFRSMEEFEKPVSFDVINLATGIKRMPNGGMYLTRETLNSIFKGEV